MAEQKYPEWVWHNGKIVPVSFWRLQHRNDPPDNLP